jgi:hypothetical protein
LEQQAFAKLRQLPQSAGLAELALAATLDT